MRVALTPATISEKFLAQLSGDELDCVAETSARPDTASIVVSDGETLLAYAVFGFDDGGLVNIYAARADKMGFAGTALLRSMFGAAQVLGKPLTVHSDKVRAMARAIGATDFEQSFNELGEKFGVFNG